MVLITIDTFSGYGATGPFQSANSNCTIVALEINLHESGYGVLSITKARADRQCIQWPSPAP